jgi:hypothetical protein
MTRKVSDNSKESRVVAKQKLDWCKFSDGWASGSMICADCGKVFKNIKFRYSRHDKVEGDWPKCCNRLAKFGNDWKPILTIDQVYDQLICEFTHWDICLTGLINYNGERCFCEVEGWWGPEDDHKDIKYTIHKIDWTSECEEYLSDYRKAYNHWFYKDKIREEYDGRPLKWFGVKWGGRNPIEEQVESC